jgi:Holliday junction resolvasome RuvABC endonuclease subunit
MGIDPGFSNTGVAVVNMEPGKNPVKMYSETISTMPKHGSRVIRIKMIMARI